MKVVYAKRIDKYFPLRFPQSIKGDKLEYFIRGEGYKKTKVFEILDVELPETHEPNWFEICEIMDEYGIHVAKEYAERKVAGIIAAQTVEGYYFIYQKIKDHLPEHFDYSFFDMMKCDYMLSCIGMYTLDIVGLDNRLAKIDPEYDNELCTYRKKCNVSMNKYVGLKYGEDYNKLIDLALKGENEELSDPNQLSLFEEE